MSARRTALRRVLTAVPLLVAAAVIAQPVDSAAAKKKRKPDINLWARAGVHAMTFYAEGGARVDFTVTSDATGRITGEFPPGSFEGAGSGQRAVARVTGPDGRPNGKLVLRVAESRFLDVSGKFRKDRFHKHRVFGRFTPASTAVGDSDCRLRIGYPRGLLKKGVRVGKRLTITFKVNNLGPDPIFDGTARVAVYRRFPGVADWSMGNVRARQRVESGFAGSGDLVMYFPLEHLLSRRHAARASFDITVGEAALGLGNVELFVAVEALDGGAPRTLVATGIDLPVRTD